jgi:DUF1680 family protein
MRILLVTHLAVALGATAQSLPDRGFLQYDSVPEARFKFAGLAGERVEANIENWLLRAPQANPGMIGMFRVRDRQPTPQLVPWAGEFVGKYLISAVQALRMTDDPRLFLQVSNVVAEFVATQAEDGYLGPFPKDIRLLKNWDLWGHYHALYALLLWHQHTGDPHALAAARKAGDLVCRTYLDTNRRVLDTGDAEMNMAILTGMAMLHRFTGEARYLRMTREVERDWERAGDYLRAGLDGREYFQSPRPRWESLHDLQGLFELWRITGESKYREAFAHHWRSIRRCDRRNTGAFSSGEQATGNPYAPTAIETCCTVAWIALTLDYVKLTGDPYAVDDLELATLNAGLGAQHVSGRWWTYNTPMDGVREASAHTIVFQARVGTPELNCCSVNGPRALGMLSEWAVMSAPDGLVINSYLPGTFTLPCRGERIRFKLDRDYPRTDSQRITIAETGKAAWTLKLRIPAWSTHTQVKANFKGAPTTATAGSFLEISRRWKAGDAVELQFAFDLRAVTGANEAAGKVSLYRGPLLLAWDQAGNPYDEDRIPTVSLTRLREARLLPLDTPRSALQPRSWVRVELPAEHGGVLRLVDFASAGTVGTHYRSWLPASHATPPAFTQYPRDGERVRPGPIEFQWRVPRRHAGITYRLELAADVPFTRILLTTNGVTDSRATLDLAPFFASSTNCWWRVVTLGPAGETVPDLPPARFTLAGDAAPQALPPAAKAGPHGELIIHSLRGEERPKFGEVLSARFATQGPDGTRVGGHRPMLVYAVPVWPADDFAVAVRVRIDEMPQGRIGQIFSAWAAGMDDPLRLVVDQGKVCARVEAAGVFGTPGVAIQAGAWHHVAATREGAKLTLFLDGRPAGSCAVPEFTATAARDCALGGNPHFSGDESLAATFADFGFWDRALSAEELRGLAATR